MVKQMLPQDFSHFPVDDDAVLHRLNNFSVRVKQGFLSNESLKPAFS